MDSSSSSGSQKGSFMDINLKILVPSVAAGAIIGKGGETIADVQYQTGAKVKMSKANDFYPGTYERVCLISGSQQAIQRVLEFILEKIRDKPDPNARTAIDFDNKVSAEREKQVKVLVPNSTAGMIIGKGGAFIKQLKEDSGAFVQISQKSKDTALQERVITVIGDPENNMKAMSMILDKIADDPQSGSCLNISYSDVQGLVANFNPTGSPFALNGVSNGQSSSTTNISADTNGKHSSGPTTPAGSVGSSPQHNHHHSQSSSSSSSNPFVIPLHGGGSLQLNFNMNINRPPTDQALISQYMDHIRSGLLTSGYSKEAIAEIVQAINCLSIHGILVVSLSPILSHQHHNQLLHHQGHQAPPPSLSVAASIAPNVPTSPSSSSSNSGLFHNQPPPPCLQGGTSAVNDMINRHPHQQHTMGPFHHRLPQSLTSATGQTTQGVVPPPFPAPTTPVGDVAVAAIPHHNFSIPPQGGGAAGNGGTAVLSSPHGNGNGSYSRYWSPTSNGVSTSNGDIHLSPVGGPTQMVVTQQQQVPIDSTPAVSSPFGISAPPLPHQPKFVHHHFQQQQQPPPPLHQQQGNKNSFGLATGPAQRGFEEQLDQIELEVNESIVGAVIGPSGKSVVDIQQLSGARIQISKKGTFSPGTRNRIVTIHGPQKSISSAKYLIERKIQEKETQRERNSY